MAWRLLLSERPIRRLDILPGKPSLVAAWTSIPAADSGRMLERVAFHDLSSGTKADERTLDQPVGIDKDDVWRTYLLTLTAPNKDMLPIVRTGRGLLLSARTSASRALLTPTGSLVTVRDEDGKITETPLGYSAALPPAAFDFDRANGPSGAAGMLAALDTAGQVHLFKAGVRLGVYPTPLVLTDDLQPALALTDMGSLYVTDGRRLCAVEANGTLRRTLDLHYPAGALACSPDGRLVAVTDLESHVLRVYGADLTLTHQRFAVDLLADARRTQLIGGMTLAGTAVGAIAITNKGVVTFAVGGALCATNLTRMKALPAPARSVPQP